MNKGNERVVFLGGDHSISYSTGKAFLEKHKEKAFFIVFDAHVDLMESMKEPTHEEWLRGLIDSGLSPENLVIVGARDIDSAERTFIDDKNIKVLDFDKIDEVIGMVKDKEIYLSIDIDVVNPEDAPSTGCKVDGGVSGKEMLEVCEKFGKMDNIKAVDIVEIDSEADKEKGNKTVKLAGEILGRFLN